MSASQTASCALCDSPITIINASKEHLIPNAIGGRIKISGFICKACNSRCGETWDAALAAQLNPLCLLLKISRERGIAPTQEFEVLGGGSICLTHEGKKVLPKPSFRKTAVGDKFAISLTARSHSEAKGMLVGLKKKHPSLNVEETLKQLNDQADYSNDLIKMNLQLDGRNTGRSLVKSTLALAVKNGVDPKVCKNAIQYLKDESAEACFGYFYERDLILNRPNNCVFHCVAISNKTSHGQLLGYVEFFNAYRMVVCLSDAYSGHEVHDVYAIDPISGKEIDIQFDLSLSQEDVSATYRDEKIPAGSMESAFDIPLSIAVRTDFEDERDRAIEQAVAYAFKNCGAAEGELLTDEQKKKVALLAAEKMMPFFRRHMKKENYNRPLNEEKQQA